MHETGLTMAMQHEWGLELRPGSSLEEIRSVLSAHISDLIDHDPNRLVSLLYRIDVNEHKLKQLLAARTGTDSALLIADLVLERQLQKLSTRRASRSEEDDHTGEERW